MTNPTIQDSRCLLVSMPQMQDPNFYQSVTLLTEYDQESAMGLILNRQTDSHINQALASDIPGGNDIPVFFGGPVQIDRGCYIHAYPDISTEGLSLPQGIYMNGSIETMEKIIQQHQHDDHFFFRFFVGYSGWGESQLEEEMAESSWITHPIDKEFIFMTPPERLWDHSLQRLGIQAANLVAPPSSGQKH